MNPTIYCIRNIINNRIYIGSALDFIIRIRTHFLRLSQGNHHSYKLQNDYNLYGKDFFEFYILYELEVNNNESKEELRKRMLSIEQQYLDNTKAYIKGYNICSKSDSNLGTKRTDEQRKKISEGIRKRNWKPSETQRLEMAERTKNYWKTLEGEARKSSEETKLKISQSHKTSEKVKLANKNKGKTLQKKVIHYDINGKFINVYNSITETSDILKIKKETIINCCKGKNKYSMFGFFKYYEANFPEIIEVPKFRKFLTEVYQYTKEGEYIKSWKNAKDIQDKLGFSGCSISACCKGKEKFHTAYGFKWSYDKLDHL